MNSSYFDSARIWYSSFYLDSYYSRLFYLVLAVLNIFCFGFAFSVYNNTPTGIHKLNVVAKLDVNDEYLISVRKKRFNDNQLDIANFAIEKSIDLIESFEYTENFLEDMKNKNEILENIFSQEAISKYLEDNDEYNQNSDIYYAERGMSKDLTIKRISFLGKDGKDITDSLVYKLFGIKKIDHVEVLISIYNKMTEEEFDYKINLKYNLKIPKRSKNEGLYFVITDYNKEQIIDEV